MSAPLLQVDDLKVDFDINTVPPADRVIYVNNQFGSLEFSILTEP